MPINAFPTTGEAGGWIVAKYNQIPPARRLAQGAPPSPLRNMALIGIVVMILEQMVSLLTNHWLFFVNGFFAALIIGALLAGAWVEGF